MEGVMSGSKMKMTEKHLTQRINTNVLKKIIRKGMNNEK